MKRNATLLLGLIALFVVAGCSNIGNENPISPQMMKEQGEREKAARGGFQPDRSRPASPGG